MNEESLIEVIKSQQETIKELLDIISKLSEDRDVKIVPMPYRDNLPEPSNPWQPNPWNPFEPNIPYTGEPPYPKVNYSITVGGKLPEGVTYLV